MFVLITHDFISMENCYANKAYNVTVIQNTNTQNKSKRIWKRRNLCTHLHIEKVSFIWASAASWYDNYRVVIINGWDSLSNSATKLVYSRQEIRVSNSILNFANLFSRNVWIISIWINRFVLHLEFADLASFFLVFFKDKTRLLFQTNHVHLFKWVQQTINHYIVLFVLCIHTHWNSYSVF